MSPNGSSLSEGQGHIDVVLNCLIQGMGTPNIATAPGTNQKLQANLPNQSQYASLSSNMAAWK